MKLGIVSSAYMHFDDMAPGALLMKSHGYDCADYQHFIDTTTDFFQLSEAEFEKMLRTQRAAMDAAGIFPNQTHGPWRSPKDATPEDRAERFASMSKGIRGAAYLGSPYFVIHPIMPFGGNSPEQPDVMKAINEDFFGRLSEVGREYGVIVCLENMPFTKLPITTAAHVTEFVKEIGSDYMRVCLDTGHYLVCGESPADAVRTVGKDLLAVLHVHDNDGTRDLHRNPGQGIADWTAFSAALHEIGFDGTFSLETAVNREDLSEEAFAEAQKKLPRRGGSSCCRIGGFVFNCCQGKNTFNI